MNITKLHKKYFDFMDRHLPFGGLVRRNPYAIVFKTTNWCWYKCAHCCESAGPDQMTTFIPATTIKSYLAQAMADPMFDKNVVFTGGEIMSSYRFDNADYVPELLTFCRDNKLGTDLKTNTGWINTSVATQIFDDLHSVVTGGPDYWLQVSLSLDKFHANSMENSLKFITKIATRPDMRVCIHIGMLGPSASNDYDELKKHLRERGFRVGRAFSPNTGQRFDVVNNVIMYPTLGTLFAGGRAKNLSDAYHNKIPQFTVLSDDMHTLMAFDSFGRVTLGENDGHKIKTRWRASDGTSRSLWNIRRDLVSRAQYEELRYRILTGKKVLQK